MEGHQAVTTIIILLHQIDSMPPSPFPTPRPLGAWAWAQTHLLPLMRLGDAALRDDFDRVGAARLPVRGFITAGETPLGGEGRGSMSQGPLDKAPIPEPPRARDEVWVANEHAPGCLPAYLPQQATFEVGTAAAWIRDEAPGIRRRGRPSQHLGFGSGSGQSTRRWSGPGGRRGPGGSTRERARGQEAGGGLHAGGSAWRGAAPARLDLRSARPGRAERCQDSLRCARARGSWTFLSMNACPPSPAFRHRGPAPFLATNHRADTAQSGDASP